MAVLDPLHPLQSSIIELLGRDPGMDMQTLHARLTGERQLTVSVQNLYRTVAQMIETQILVREKGKLSLNLVWVTHFIRHAEEFRRGYIASPQDMSDIPLIDGDRREFFADSLAALDPVWNHLLSKVANQYPTDPIWYEYNSHAWHVLAMTDTELRLYESLGKAGHKLFGNDTFLDRHGARLSAGSAKSVVTADPPFPKEGYSLWVCGDYLVDCIFPDLIAKHFAFFFRTVNSMQEFDLQLFSEVFKMKARCKVMVWKSSEESRLLRSKFEPFFRSTAA